MAKVLIICPTFDHQDTLYSSLESVRRQTYQDFEVVVIGDGAPPRTQDIMAQISSQDSRFRYEWHPKHERTGEPHRDPIIRASDCEIVAYIADDDLWLPWHLEWVVSALEDHDFAHSMHYMLNVDGHTQAIPFQFASPALRALISERKTWCFGLSYAAHTRAAYLQLDEGWATTRPGVATDLNMWAKFGERREFRIWEMLYPTALHFHSKLRSGCAPSHRANEAFAVLETFADPNLVGNILDRTSFSEHFRYLFHATTPREIPDINGVFRHHQLDLQVIPDQKPPPKQPLPGTLYCRQQALDALNIQWRAVAGHTSHQSTRRALSAMLKTWPENHDARTQLAELYQINNDLAGAEAALAG